MTCRPEQLNLVPDPGFNIDLDLGLDPALFEYTMRASERSSQSSTKSDTSSHTSLSDLEHGRISNHHSLTSSHAAADDAVGFYLDGRSPLLAPPTSVHAVPHVGLDITNAIDENGLDVNEFDEIVLPSEASMASLLDIATPRETGLMLSVEDDDFMMPDIEAAGSVQGPHRVGVHTKTNEIKLTLAFLTG